jgi:hypothetical protein
VHHLDFIIPSDLNTRAFRIEDISVYEDTLGYNNGLVEVTPPGFTTPIIFRVNRDFKLILNANLLHLNTSGFKILPTLPDGVYTIRYSIAPNARVAIEYDYFRNVLQESYYLKLLIDLRDKRNLLTNKEYSKRLKELLTIKEYIVGAKYLAEDLVRTKDALELYNEINTLLKDFEKCHLEKI